jgi:hypothetical protein
MKNNFTDPHPSNNFFLFILEILEESILFGENFEQGGGESFFRFLNYI